MTALALQRRHDRAIDYPHQFANDAILVSNHRMGMAGSSPAMTALALRGRQLALRAVRQQLRPLVLLAHTRIGIST
jgi:hypothetical protein